MIEILRKFRIYSPDGNDYLSPELQSILDEFREKSLPEAQKSPLKLSQFLTPLLKLFLHGRGEINYELIQRNYIFHIFFNFVDMPAEGANPFF